MLLRMHDKNNDQRIDYIELPARDIAASKAFYASVFGWQYKDWGPDYADTHDGRLGSGLSVETKAPLVVIYARDLEAALARVTKAGGAVTRDVFDFPGGRRFHFRDPHGNELAVWSDPK
jgi:uncharacterized protein